MEVADHALSNVDIDRTALSKFSNYGPGDRYGIAPTLCYSSWGHQQEEADGYESYD